MTRLPLLIIIGLIGISNVFANTLEKSLYIISDSIQTVDSLLVPYLSFNETDSYTKDSPIITLNYGDTLKLWVYNLDSISHGFAIKEVSGNYTIPAGDSVYVEQVFVDEGLYIYHDTEE